MNIYSIFATLLASSISAQFGDGSFVPNYLQSEPYYSPAYPPSFLNSRKPQAGDKCYHGNQRNVAPATGPSYPPCWYLQSDNEWACFNKVNGQCPWSGAQDPPSGGSGKAICYHGNQRNVPPATGPDYPPCWYKQSDGAWACFNKVNDQCPWSGAVGPQTSSYLSIPSFLNSDNPQAGDKCYYGNQRNIAPATGPNYPPCWYKQSDGAWACFDKKDNKCPFDGAKNPPSGGNNKSMCYNGNQRNSPNYGPNWPECWYKQNDGAWACFSKVNGKCPFDGSVGPQTSAFLSAPSFLNSRRPQAGDKCYHGNQRNVAPATGPSYPPCWYLQSDNEWACFNKVNGQCPWSGAQDPPSGGSGKAICYHGNQRNVPPATGPDYPPCWYKQSDGAWACFNKVNGQCPWNGAVGPQTSSYLNTPSFLNSDNPQAGDKCYYGNQRNIAPATGPNYPPCWYKQSDGAWACFDKKDNKCPFDGAKNPPSGGNNKSMCYNGNQRNSPNYGPNWPECWYKQNDGAWACFSKVNGKCPFDGSVGPQTSAFLSTPEYMESPNLLHAVRNFLLSFQ